MDVREKLVELLNEMQDSGIVETPAGFGFTKRYIENDKVASHLFDNGATVQEWISTDERMPTEDDATDGYLAVVHDWGDGVKTKTISLVDVVIAHPDLYDYWMPLNLPQPPKGE